MMRRALPIGILLFAALWLAGWLVWVPRIQERVREEARRSLQESINLREVHVEAQGRTVLLTGTVPSEADVTLAETMVRHGVPLLATVSSDLIVKPPPPGWFLLGFAGEAIHLTGVVASMEELQEVLAETRRQHEKPGVRVSASIRVEADRFGAPDSLHRTTASIPTARSGLTKDRGAFAFATSGSGWKVFPAEAESSVLRSISSQDSNSSMATSLVSPLSQAVREYDARQIVAKAERERLLLLPPPFLILMREDESWLLRGEVGSAEEKSQVLAFILRHHPEKRVLDDIRVTPRRNPFSDLDSLTIALEELPDAPGESTAYVGVPGHGWLPCDLSQPEPAAILQDKVTDTDAALIVKDLLAARHAIESSHSAPVHDLPAFLTMILLPGRVILGGEVPDEASRSQTLAAVRGTYPGMTLTNDLRLNVRCAPATGLLHTLKALPSPRMVPREGLLAFATPGETWSQKTVDETLLSTDGVAASGLVPGDVLLQRAMESLLTGLPVLRAHFEEQSRTRRKS